MKTYRIISFFIAIFICSGLLSAKTYKTEVCVYGGTASGVMSAIQVARMGADVILLCTDNHVGGVATSGLTATDINKHLAVGGLAQEFYNKIYEYYLKEENWHNETRDEFMIKTKKRTFSGKNDTRKMQWVYESHVGEAIMKEMLEQAGVKVIYNTRLDLSKSAKVKNAKIHTIYLENGHKVKADVFVDASYEGDLMAKSGVSYIVGREGVSEYGESLAGIRNHAVINYDGFMPDGSLIPLVADGLYGEYGEGDGRTQAYCYRLTLTDDKDNMVPLSEPEGYDPAMFEMIYRRMLSEGKTELKDIITFTPMPNRKTDTNHLDYIGASFEYPEADYDKREAIAKEHELFAKGMLWFFATDSRVPQNMRDEMNRWGYPKDEFVDNGNFPHQLYVRESRRMKGKYIMTQHDIQKTQRDGNEQSVGLGTYALDCHFVSFVTEGDSTIIEGGIFVPVKPYPIEYSSIVPKQAECENLIVPVCMSASHVAYSSIRMEPVYMVLGQSAAVIAVMSINQKCAVQELDYNEIKKTLLECGQILQYKQ